MTPAPAPGTLLLAAFAAIASGPSAAPTGSADAVIDLGTVEGVAQVGGAWRYHDAVLDPVDFPRPGADGKPTGQPGRTTFVAPAAGGAGFDDSSWEIIDPTTLAQRRSAGRDCFAWYRIGITVPPRVGDFDPSGSTAVLEIVVDDYAEVWVDGRLPRTLGQTGGSMIAGWNAPNRVVLGRDVRPGQRFSIAVFAINGPISDPPANFIWVRSARVEFFGTEATSAGVTFAPPVTIERLDPRLDAIVAPGAAVRTLADGFSWVEGPLWDASARCLYFSDIPDNAVYRWRDGEGATLALRPAGYSGAAPFRGREPGANGLAMDASGRLILCQQGDRRVARLEADGKVTVLADRYQGKRLNSPNDVIAGSDGELYFTDPPFGLPGGFDDPARELEFCGVYRLGTGDDLDLLIKDVAAPNGVALSPGRRTLYVSNADAVLPVVFAYDLGADGRPGPPRVFFDAAEWVGRAPGKGVPDGMAISRLGTVFLGGPAGVYVIAPDGRLLGRIDTGVATSNCELSPDESILFVTAAHAVIAVGLRGGGGAP